MSGRLASVALAAIALAAAIVGATRGDERERYVAANEALLDELPRYPGARRLSVRSSGYYEGDSAWSAIAGYTTLALYAIPSDAAPDEIGAFYERALTPGWGLVERIAEDPRFAAGPILRFRRGAATVSVNLESYRGGILEIAVDHAGGN